MFRRRNFIGQKLRQLRRAKGVSGQLLAKKLGYNQSGISRIESGEFKPSQAYVKRFCEVLDVPISERDALLEITHAFLVEYNRWYWEKEEQKATFQDVIAKRESKAKEIREFEWKIVPGLLQTDQYARAIIRLASGPLSEATIESAVRGRLARQSILSNPGKRIAFILYEGALHTPILPAEEMVKQISHIDSLLVHSRAEIRILPFGKQWSTFCADSFSIYDNHVVEIDTHTSTVSLFEPEDVDLYRSLFARLLEDSFGGQSARSMLKETSKVLMQRKSLL